MQMPMIIYEGILISQYFLRIGRLLNILSNGFKDLLYFSKVPMYNIACFLKRSISFP